MKKNQKIIALVAMMPLALIACGESVESSSPTVTETVTVTAEPEIRTETVTVTAEPEVVTVTAEPEEPEVIEEETEETAGALDPSAEVTYSDRGHVMKEVGEVGGIVSPDGDVLVQFTLTEVEQNFQCNSSLADPPANGQYIALHWDVETTPLLEDTFSISEWDLILFSPDGVRENDSSGNAMWCAESSQTLPSSIGPGQKASGIVVLDTALDSGTIVYQPMFSLESIGWEWDF